MKRTTIPWTSPELAYLRYAYADTPTVDIADRLGVSVKRVYGKAKRMGLKKSKDFLISTKSGRFNGPRDPTHCFPKGHIPWNKGLRGVITGGLETQFKPGIKPFNHRPIGSTRINVDGYVEIKVAEGKFQWRLLHRETWKEHHGEYPQRDMILTFKDGNKQNCEIGNLLLITRKELMARNTIQRYSPELQEVIRLNARLKRKTDEQPKQ